MGRLGMDFFDVVKIRRSIRSYTNKPISEKEIERLLDAGRLAPSAGNIQCWKFLIVRRKEKKQLLSVAAFNQTFIEEASAVLVVCTDMRQSEMNYGSRGVNLYSIQDAAAAIENILLAACALGLGACWVGAFNEEIVRLEFNIPEHIRPLAIVPVGHPSEKPLMPPKRFLEEIVYYETF